MLGVALSVLAGVMVQTSAPQAPTRPRHIKTLAPPGESIRRVVLESQSQVIAPGDGTREYPVALERGQVALGEFRGRGIDLTLSVRDASGRIRGQFYGGPTYAPFDVVATEAGIYKLSFRPAPSAAKPGILDIKMHIVSVDEYAARLDRREFGENSELYRIAQDIRRRGEQAVDSVVEERRGKGPIVEPYPPDPKQRLVTFLYRGDERTEQVNTWAFELGTAPLNLRAIGTMPMPLQRLAGSTLWYLRTCLPSDTLMGYSFEVVRSHVVSLADGRTLAIRDEPRDINDPLVSDSTFGKSLLRLDEAPVQPWIVPDPNVPHGRLSSRSILSRALGEERKFTVYTPPGIDSGGRLLIVFDGEAYGSRGSLVPTPTVLDNLIARRLIPPTVAVFVDAQTTRMRDLPNFPPFARFIAAELLPWVQRNYGVSRRAGDTVVAGSSLGGLCAAYVAFSYPGKVGAALCQSPAMYPSPGPLFDSTSFIKIRDGFTLTRQFMAARRKPIRFYVDSGLFEGPLLDGDRQFCNVLRLKGYPLTYVEHSGSHDYAYWRNSIGDGLVTLLGHPRSRAIGHHRSGHRVRRTWRLRRAVPVKRRR